MPAIMMGNHNQNNQSQQVLSINGVKSAGEIVCVLGLMLCGKGLFGIVCVAA